MTRRRYLGVFVGIEAAQDRWLQEKAEGCQDLVAIMAGVAGKHQQTAYMGL